MCACGCGAEVRNSLYWATELCYMRWMSRRAERPAEPATVRTYCGATYTERVAAHD
jgi:hypothetical protein